MVHALGRRHRCGVPSQRRMLERDLDPRRPITILRLREMPSWKLLLLLGSMGDVRLFEHSIQQVPHSFQSQTSSLKQSLYVTSGSSYLFPPCQNTGNPLRITSMNKEKYRQVRSRIEFSSSRSCAWEADSNLFLFGVLVQISDFSFTLFLFFRAAAA